ncbi:dihydroneopterin aldolase [Xanthobacter sp. V3C-3]|uniref:dihydroneopterin aldolase n=1 Tax=Xanthobacter lutulentifluminis TaxID=3119935 RepID=UPI00372796C1
MLDRSLVTRPPHAAAGALPHDRQFLILRGFKVEALIGVYSAERHAPQALDVRLEIEIPDKGGGYSDRLSDTIDYGAIVYAIREEAKESRFFLLEALAEQLCNLLFARFEALSVRLEMTKTEIIDGVKDAGIRLERHAPSF